MEISNKKKISAIVKQPHFSFIREDAFLLFSNILNDIKGKKSLIVDSEINIDLVFTAKQLTQLEILTFDILEDKHLSNTHENIVYLIKSESANLIVKHMMKELNNNKIYHMIFVPNTNIQHIDLFQKYMMKCLICVKLYQLPLYIYPIDYNILSVEYKFYCRNVLDLTPDLHLTNALLQIQNKLGVIPIIQGIGHHSQLIIKNFLTERANNVKNVNISRLVIIDRECDYLTTLLSQQNYSGLINETFQDMVINDNDVIYRQLKNKNIEDVRNIIIRKIKDLHYSHKNINTEDISSINQSIKNISIIENEFPQHLLVKHFDFVEKIINKLNQYEFSQTEYDLLISDTDMLSMKYLQNIKFNIFENEYETFIINKINDNKSPLKILRILCLYCIVNNGIDIAFVDKVKSLMIKTYGINCCFIFENLFAAGILFPKSVIFNWNDIKQKFSLTNNPLSCKLIESALSVTDNILLNQKRKDVLMSGWKDNKINNKLKLLKLPSFHVIQDMQYNIENDLILVCFVGPITHTEISYLRSSNDKIIILTTKIINGNTFIESMI